MTTTRIYKSTDTSAPVLVGGVSSLINLLDKCLVTGYGSATPAGWTKPYTGTDKAAFRNSVAAGGSGMYLRVVDDGTATGGARNALCRAYLTMSDVDTGTIETPTVAQVAASIVWRKSNTADSTPRAWVLIADERTFWLSISTETNSVDRGHGLYGAGDIASFLPGDSYPFFIVGRETQHAAGLNGTHQGICTPCTALFASPVSNGAWIARGIAGTGNPIRAGIPMPCQSSEFQPIGASSYSIASPAPGVALDFWVPALIGSEATIRGQWRGLYAPLTSPGTVTLGHEVVDPPGITGTLTALRHYAASNNSNLALYDCHMRVLSDQAWPA
ncbi:MAG: hypothetical protein KDI12_12985 [Anaerolineae bacterium]|nr:hypothetical protein [Anaerolineae bacterium]